MNTQRQYVLAEYLSVLLVCLGLVFLGSSAGYWLSFQKLASACGPLTVADQLCVPTLQSLSQGVQWSLIGGVVSMVSGGGMRYMLQQAEP